jgi:hypothetical protein
LNFNTQKGIASRTRISHFLGEGESEMSKKGETGEQDRSKPQPQKKKDRNAKRKEKKAARLERQKSR